MVAARSVCPPPPPPPPPFLPPSLSLPPFLPPSLSLSLSLSLFLVVLYEVANRLGLFVNLEKTKIIIFRNGGYLARAERWYYGSEPVSVASSSEYFSLKFIAKICLNLISQDSVLRAKQGPSKSLKCCRILAALTSTCFSNCSTHRLYLSCSKDLNGGIVLIVQMLGKCTCTPVKGY